MKRFTVILIAVFMVIVILATLPSCGVLNDSSFYDEMYEEDAKSVEEAEEPDKADDKGDCGDEDPQAEEEEKEEQITPSEESEEEEKPLEVKYQRYWRDLMVAEPRLATVSLNRLYMLGSHDTFTDKICSYSEPDTVYGNAWVNNEQLLTMAKYFYMQLGKAQAVDAYEQLCSGVRYLDLRVSEIGDELYNCHGLISDTLRNNLLLVLQFLDENPGEFIIINLHKYYTNNEWSYDRVADYMEDVKYKGKNIYDYINYDRNVHEYSALNYNTLTDCGTKAGVVLIGTVKNIPYHSYFSQFTCGIYMPNFSEIDSVEKVTCIIDDLDNAKTAKSQNKLMVCQAQTTPNEEDFRTYFNWSLLAHAVNHNEYVLTGGKLSTLLDVYPIIEFDYVTYNGTGDNDIGFLDEIIGILANRNLRICSAK